MNPIKQNIVEVFKINDLPEAEQEEMLARLGKIIFQAVLLRILPLFDENTMSEYDKLMDSDASPEAVLDFFMEKVPAFSQIAAEETENLKKEAVAAQ